MAGTIGHLLILTALVACALAGLAFLQANRSAGSPTEWQRIGRGAWMVMLLAVTAAFGLLIYLNVTHQFQYAYVHQHTSRGLPLKYLVSASWAGQEGSFLLWIVLNALVGAALIRWADRDYEAPVMTVVAFCQVFLISMIAGLRIGAVSIGSSPFLTLAEKFPDAPMLQAGLVPSDGQGLNDLLQNYWMAIHPPTLFVGFASMIVPFAFAVAALWKRRYTEWVRPALPWTLFAVMALGVGIAMGGYWAYETLSFGGYWAWDPVENSSLVPWLIGVAAVHTMIIQKKSGISQKASLFLSILAYMLVIYSTFLTRSGILGDISVHSFVDLGLYNQLLLWILAMGVVGFGLLAYRYRELPRPRQEPALLSREFMIFCGAMLLCAVGAVVLLGTSTPIIGRLFRDNPSTVPLAFYNKWTLPLSILFVFLAGLGQLFWWHKMSVENVNRVLLKPVVLSVVSTVAVLVFTPFVERTAVEAPAPGGAMTQAGLTGSLGTFWASYGTGLLLLLLVFVAFFALYGNGLVLWRIARGNPRLAGGAFAHVGLAVMVLGIVASSGFSRGLGVDPNGMGRKNFVVEHGQTVAVDGYRFTYRGTETNAEGRPAYVLDVVDPQGRRFTVRPVVYKSNKEQWIQHPDVRLGAWQDLFVAVSPSLMFETQQAPNTLTLSRGETARLDDGRLTLRFVDFDLNAGRAYLNDTTAIAVGATLEITEADGRIHTLTPVYLVARDGAVRLVPARLDDGRLEVAFTGMDVSTEAITLAVEGATVAPEDWLVVQAYEKPFINLVWMGILLLTFGFGLSAYRRAQDHRARRRETA
ncbi:cytochrome c biogenesis protein CcsA [Rhodocaloribacter litoris]|uniref:heme lyase CcmF/NrfE family subunit n=1 Tax=Rhodocaloribacter litoris TaxID=2558931 RepID=UPI00141FE318|nr:cytochrome c biogenesis protein CcsA [Rhodocaloribacter litoris]QXD15589.1 cytochrome c biogenesis protein CcsA [Rhodocaloribacter litoris]GIV60909.1 MAG: cytochrome c assembly protein [Rhodothermaceae bacterium]